MKTINGFMMVAFTTLLFTFLGCSQDDDYYDSDMYTMAEELETRTPEPGGGQKKKRINWIRKDYNISLPKGTLDSDPMLYGEYDDETLSVSISNYSGNINLYIVTLPGNSVMGYAEGNVTGGTQFNFSLASYTIGVTYQIIVSLDNGDAYWGEFEL